MKVATIRANVDRTFSELTEHMKRCHQQVLQDFDKQATARKKIHSANVEEAELAHTRLTSIVAFIERLLQSSDACEISTMANHTIEQCNKLEANQRGEAEKSWDWKLEGVEKSKESLQCVTVKRSYPSQVKTTTKAHSHHKWHLWAPQVEMEDLIDPPEIDFFDMIVYIYDIKISGQNIL